MKSLWHFLTYPFRIQPRGSLASYQPRRDRDDRDVPLGMEAINMDAVAAAQRRNDALERINAVHSDRRYGGSDTQATATHVALMPEDETYAARYHRLYQRQTKKGS